MPLVQADHLSRIGAALLRAAGASDEEANAVATGCVNGVRRGAWITNQNIKVGNTRAVAITPNTRNLKAPALCDNL